MVHRNAALQPDAIFAFVLSLIAKLEQKEIFLNNNSSVSFGQQLLPADPVVSEIWSQNGKEMQHDC